MVEAVGKKSCRVLPLVPEAVEAGLVGYGTTTVGSKEISVLHICRYIYVYT